MLESLPQLIIFLMLGNGNHKVQIRFWISKNLLTSTNDYFWFKQTIRVDSRNVNSTVTGDSANPPPFVDIILTHTDRVVCIYGKLAFMWRGGRWLFFLSDCIFLSGCSCVNMAAVESWCSFCSASQKPDSVWQEEGGLGQVFLSPVISLTPRENRTLWNN